MCLGKQYYVYITKVAFQIHSFSREWLWVLANCSMLHNNVIKNILNTFSVYALSFFWPVYVYLSSSLAFHFFK